MDTIKHWTVDIHLTEHDAEGVVRTHAEARLRARDDTDLRGRGEARKHPDDPDVPEIGDELAASRRCRRSPTHCSRPPSTTSSGPPVNP